MCKYHPITATYFEEEKLRNIPDARTQKYDIN